MLVLLAEPAGVVMTRAAEVIAALSIDELQRAARFHRPTDHDDFVAAHVAVRLCVAALTGRPVRGIGVDQRCEQCGGPHGRPYVAGAPDIKVSWAHSGGWVAAAATDRGPVGIDLQIETRPPRHRQVVWSALSAAEAGAVRAAADPHREFLRHWVVKESLVKAGVCALDDLAHAEALRPLVLLPNGFLDEPGLLGACVAPAQEARRLTVGADPAGALLSRPFSHPVAAGP